jgi:hypothetical protein
MKEVRFFMLSNKPLHFELITACAFVSVMGVGFSSWLITGGQTVTAGTITIFAEPVVETVNELFSYDSINSTTLNYISESFWDGTNPSYKGTLISIFNANNAVNIGQTFNYKIEFLAKTGYTPTISLLDGSLIQIPSYQITYPLNSSSNKTTSFPAISSDGSLSYTTAYAMSAGQQLKISLTFDASIKKNSSTGLYSDDLDFNATIYPFLQNTTIKIFASWN